jgi:hypothetical protein
MKKLESIEEKVLEIKKALEDENLKLTMEKINITLDEIYK